MYPYSVL